MVANSCDGPERHLVTNGRPPEGPRFGGVLFTRSYECASWLEVTHGLPNHVTSIREVPYARS